MPAVDRGPFPGTYFGESCWWGVEPVGDLVNCQACELGWFSDGPGPCEPCPLGTFAADVGTGVCTSCPADTFAANLGQAACDPCPENQFSPEGAHACQACPLGTYRMQGMEDCAPCPSFGVTCSDGTIQPHP